MKEALIDLLKVILLSIVEGITEFLPVSSTGHLILVNEFLKLEPESFANAFSIIIQLGAILSVVVIYFDRLNPWSGSKLNRRALPEGYRKESWGSRFSYRFLHYDRPTMDLWKKILIAIIPAGILGVLFDDLIDAKLMNMKTVSLTLFLYGVIMILMEKKGLGGESSPYTRTEDFSYRMALEIGCFQCLAMVPGTSRSAATIIGAMVLGASRTAAAEFSFFLAIPTMVGATLLKIMKNLGSFSTSQWLLILIGFVLSFIVAYLVIRRFMDYLEKHDFTVFGWYRIILAVILFLYMIIFK